MPKANLIQTNFTSGEVSPLMRGRVDVNKYANGAQEIVNFLVRPQGGLLKRSGTRFVNETKFQDKKSRIREFIFSNNQSYILEFGERYVRVYRDGGVVVDGGGNPIELVTPYMEDDLEDLHFDQSADIIFVCHPNYVTQTVSRFSHTDWRSADYITQDGPYMSSTPAGVFLTIASYTDKALLTSNVAGTFSAPDVTKFVEYREQNTWKLAQITAFIDDMNVTVDVVDAIILGLDPNDKLVVSMGKVTIPATPLQFTGGTSGNPAPYQTTKDQQFVSSRNIYQKKITPAAKLTQSAGTITATFTGTFSYADIGKYVRDSAGAWWKITAFTGATDQATVSAVTLKAISWPTTIVTVSGRKFTAVIRSSRDLFSMTDPGRHLRMNLSGQQIWGRIDTVTSTKEANVIFYQDPPLDPNDPTQIASAGTTDLWKLGAWSNTTGFPTHVTFHDQRIVFGRTNAEPETIWMGQTGDFYNFAPTEPDSTVLDSSAITFTIASKQVNEIVWFEPGPVLLIGTTGGEWQVKPASSIAEPITPTNIGITPQTSHGSAKNARSRRVASAVLFIQRSNRKLQEMVYSYELDQFVAHNLTIISEHIFRQGGKAIDMAYQAEPNQLVWALLEDGTLAALTYERDQDVFAWHRHSLGANTNGAFVESIAVVPSEEGTEDELYMVVHRIINGTTRRYIERLIPDFLPIDGTDKSAMYFVDCGLSYSGSPTVTVTGLDHLEGESVTIVADGSVLPAQFVSGGRLTLQASASIIHVGYGYRTYMRSLPPEGGSPFGTSQGKTKRIHRIAVRLVNSIGFKYGFTLDNLDELSFRSSNDTMDSSPPLFTGDKIVDFDQPYDTISNYYIVSDDAYPLIILAVMPTLDTHE